MIPSMREQKLVAAAVEFVCLQKKEKSWNFAVFHERHFFNPKKQWEISSTGLPDLRCGFDNPQGWPRERHKQGYLKTKMAHMEA